MSSLYKEDRISLISRAAIFSSALLVLSNYYYLYFLEFFRGHLRCGIVGSCSGVCSIFAVFTTF